MSDIYSLGKKIKNVALVSALAATSVFYTGCGNNGKEISQILNKHEKDIGEIKEDVGEIKGGFSDMVKATENMSTQMEKILKSQNYSLNKQPEPKIKPEIVAQIGNEPKLDLPKSNHEDSDPYSWGFKEKFNGIGNAVSNTFSGYEGAFSNLSEDWDAAFNRDERQKAHIENIVENNDLQTIIDIYKANPIVRKADEDKVMEQLAQMNDTDAKERYVATELMKANREFMYNWKDVVGQRFPSEYNDKKTTWRDMVYAIDNNLAFYVADADGQLKEVQEDAFLAKAGTKIMYVGVPFKFARDFGENWDARSEGLQKIITKPTKWTVQGADCTARAVLNIVDGTADSLCATWSGKGMYTERSPEHAGKVAFLHGDPVNGVYHGSEIGANFLKGYLLYEVFSSDSSSTTDQASSSTSVETPDVAPTPAAPSTVGVPVIGGGEIGGAAITNGSGIIIP